MTNKPPDTPARRLLDRLVQAKLPGGTRYAYFWVTGEGKYLPALVEGQRVEECSGFLVDAEARTWRFWLAWNVAQRTPHLVRWRQVWPQMSWLVNDREYQEARRAVGLPPRNRRTNRCAKASPEVEGRGAQ